MDSLNDYIENVRLEELRLYSKLPPLVETL